LLRTGSKIRLKACWLLSDPPGFFVAGPLPLGVGVSCGGPNVGGVIRRGVLLGQGSQGRILIRIVVVAQKVQACEQHLGGRYGHSSAGKGITQIDP